MSTKEKCKMENKTDKLIELKEQPRRSYRKSGRNSSELMMMTLMQLRRINIKETRWLFLKNHISLDIYIQS